MAVTGMMGPEPGPFQQAAHWTVHSCPTSMHNAASCVKGPAGSMGICHVHRYPTSVHNTASCVETPAGSMAVCYVHESPTSVHDAASCVKAPAGSMVSCCTPMYPISVHNAASCIRRPASRIVVWYAQVCPTSAHDAAHPHLVQASLRRGDPALVPGAGAAVPVPAERMATGMQSSEHLSKLSAARDRELGCDKEFGTQVNISQRPLVMEVATLICQICRTNTTHLEMLWTDCLQHLGAEAPSRP